MFLSQRAGEQKGRFFMQKLWQKNWTLNHTIEAFETHGDLLLDQRLVKYDVLGSLAHAQGLHQIGLLSGTELSQLRTSLLKVLTLEKKGQFTLQLGEEDIHSKLENYLTESLGEVGKKIHTGRSRNDQVLTAIRLYTKEQLLTIWEELLACAEAFASFADQHPNVLMPGYTHMQKAMPSTLGLWSGAFLAGLLDDLTFLKTAYTLNNQSPLGSAAGYGVPLPLNKELTAQLLGFAKVQPNPLYCQNSRGKIEAAVVAALITVLQDLNKFATDLLLFTTTEFGFLSVAAELCSGSSIMPQKKNVDVAELLRSKVHLLLGNYTQLVGLSSNLMSGYNRDLQDSKKPLFESLTLTADCLEVTTLCVAGLTVNPERLQGALSAELFATHYALELVKQNVPFREAYRQAGQAYSQLEFAAFVESCTQQLTDTKQGELIPLINQLQQEKTIFTQERKKYQTSINQLLSRKGMYAQTYRL